MESPTQGEPQLVGAFGNRSGPRSKTGCRTCRERKVKCDERRPFCQRCERSARACEWGPSSRRRRTNPSSGNRQSGLDRVQLAEGEGSESDVGLILSPMSPLAGLLPTLRATSVSGITLATQHHDAVQYYRTVFSLSQDSKNPLYSVPSVLLKTGSSSRTVMHMVLAVGIQQRRLIVGVEQLDDEYSQEREADNHYREALQLLSQDLRKTRLIPRELDCILGALWLMTAYEQRFGNGVGRSIARHLKAVAGVLAANVRISMGEPFGGRAMSCAKVFVDGTQEASYLSSRLIVWLNRSDARASSFGVSGNLNESLAKAF